MSTRKPIDLEKFTQRKVTVPIVLLLGLLVLGWRMDGITVDYLDDFFITKAQADEHFQALTIQVAENTELMVTHIGEYKLNENATQIALAENQLYELEFHVVENGESTLTRARKLDIVARIARLNRVRACIVRNQHTSDDEPPDNCDAIL